MTPPCVVPTFRPYTVENLEFGGFYASSCESRVTERPVSLNYKVSQKAAASDAVSGKPQPVTSGRHVKTGLRQSIPSSM